ISDVFPAPSVTVAEKPAILDIFGFLTVTRKAGGSGAMAEIRGVNLSISPAGEGPLETANISTTKGAFAIGLSIPQLKTMSTGVTVARSEERRVGKGCRS